MANKNLLVQGMDGLINDIHNMAEQIDFDGSGAKVADAILIEAAEPVLKQIKVNTTEDPKMISGDLHNAVKKSKPRSSKTRGRFITIGVHRKDWKNHEDYYPAYVEYGHGGPAPAPAHPYLRRGYDVTEDTAYEIIRNELRKAIDDSK